jgi:DNA repair protein RadC
MRLENKIKNKPHHMGHRKRLKDKFLKSDPSHFSDYELLELYLFYSIPRRDVKPLAKNLLSELKEFKELINADQERILSIDGATESVYLQLKLMKEMFNRIFSKKIESKNVISSWASLLEYLKFNMGSLKIEQFRVLFLNKKNVLITDEVMATGTIDQTPVYPREIVRKSIFHGAGALILVHNHPSGNPKPSDSDVKLTAQIVEACKTIDVTIHDHVIIGGNEYYSFKSNMLL